MPKKRNQSADPDEYANAGGQTLPDGGGPAAPAPEISRVGRTLARRYEVERLLGRGAMGVVYAVRHLRTGGHFAAKVLCRSAIETDAYERFRDEAKIVTQLRHPHIVQVTDFDDDEDGTPFMIMELLEGETLEQRIKRQGRVPLDWALRMAEQVGAALHAAHGIGVVHRDIKPENIFLTQTGPGGAEVAKVLDFGISKIRHATVQRTQEETILGTPHFMSPEAASGEIKEIDGRADQWGLAVILYRVLCGELPFDGIDVMAVLFQVVQKTPVSLAARVPGLPAHVVRAIERGMAKSKADRFPGMDAFVQALSGSPAARGRPALRPRPLSVLVLSALLVGLVIGVVVWGLAVGRQHAPPLLVPGPTIKQTPSAPAVTPARTEPARPTGPPASAPPAAAAVKVQLHGKAVKPRPHLPPKMRPRLQLDGY